MAVSKTTGYEWIEIDPATLEPHERKAYEAMKDANRIAAKAREHFETGMAVSMPDATFGYRFGKLSFTEDAPKERKAVSSPKAINLTQWRAQRQASGDRT